MNEEMRSLLENGTWKLVKKPEGVKPVPMKWVYKMLQEKCTWESWSGTNLSLVAKGLLAIGKESTSRRSMLP